MAREAGVEGLARGHERKRSGDGPGAAFGVDVRFACAMATFAPGAFWWLLPGGNRLEMGVAKKGLPEVGVAGLAGVAADESVLPKGNTT